MEGTPRVTHYGTWNIGNDISIECYVMSNGERVLSLRGAAKTLGLTGNGSGALVRNLNTQWISPYLSDELRNWLLKANRNELPTYTGINGRQFLPFEASLFVDLCNAYVKARHDGVLKLQGQIETADKLYAIMTAFAKTGLVAIIDEVTGYQDDRDRDELQKILAQYISEELLPWTKRFPDEFYKQMFRLKGWEYRGNPKPSYAGKLTNQYIYEYLPEGVLEELKKRTPKTKSGKYSKRYHQSLTEETGIPHLDKQLLKTITLMQISDTWEEFDSYFRKAMGEPVQMSIEF